MSLSKFKTFLWPATKNAKVSFYSKYEDDSQNGSIIEADFTRANSTESSTQSGRVVVDESGNLVELSANDPGWSYPFGGTMSGSPYLSFLPGSRNLNLHWDIDSSMLGAKVNITYVSHDWGLGPLLQNAAYFNASNTQTLQYSSGNVGVGDVIHICYIEMEDGSEPILSTGGAESTADFAIVVEGGVTPPENVIKENVKNNVWRLVSRDTSAVNSTNNGVIRYPGNSGKAFFFSGFTLISSAFSNLSTEDIPTSGLSLTRERGLMSLSTFNNTLVPTPSSWMVLIQMKVSGVPSASWANLSISTTTSSGAIRIYGLNSVSNKWTIRDYRNAAFTIDLNLLEEDTFQKMTIVGNTSGVKVFYLGKIIYEVTGQDWTFLEFTDLTVPGSNNISQHFKQLHFGTFNSNSDAAESTLWTSLTQMVQDLNYIQP